MTFKYEKIKEVIKKYLPVVECHDVKNTTKKSYGEVKFTQGISLFDALDVLTQRKMNSVVPLTFEKLDLDYGFILYEKEINQTGYLNLNNVNDRANIYLNKDYVATLQRNGGVHIKSTGLLDILVENEGRINYGGMFDEVKGLYQGVKLDDVELKNWNHFGFNWSNVNEIKFTSDLPTKVPAFYKDYFDVDEVADTFLNPTGFTKGVAFINGFCIGRYWLIKPQLTLYVPQNLLHKGQNELVILELESQSSSISTMSFDDVQQIDIKSPKKVK